MATTARRNETVYLLSVYRAQEKLRRELKSLYQDPCFSTKKAKSLENKLYNLNRKVYLYHRAKQKTNNPIY